MYLGTVKLGFSNRNTFDREDLVYQMTRLGDMLKDVHQSVIQFSVQPIAADRTGSIPTAGRDRMDKPTAVADALEVLMLIIVTLLPGLSFYLLAMSDTLKP
jgi:hypothetical protein